MILHLRKMIQWEDFSLTFKGHLADNGTHPLETFIFLALQTHMLISEQHDPL